jgi:type II secretory pathway predicted ATPase ExeA
MARDRIGPIYMYGPIGSGKTSLVRRLQEKLSQDERYNVKLLISPNLKSSNAFLRLILETFDVKTERSYTASLANFEKFLISQYQAKKIPVLLIDEAQYMNREHLKLIHYLLNFETNKTKLLQIVLVGQEELGTKIIHYRLAWTAAWHLREETYRQALATLVNAQQRQPIAALFGAADVSSSDGQHFLTGGLRFGLSHRLLGVFDGFVMR